ncbi:unnamed protein product [Rhodiola kirilowii]
MRIALAPNPNSQFHEFRPAKFNFTSSDTHTHRPSCFLFHSRLATGEVPIPISCLAKFRFRLLLKFRSRLLLKGLTKFRSLVFCSTSDLLSRRSGALLLKLNLSGS